MTYFQFNNLKHSEKSWEKKLLKKSEKGTKGNFITLVSMLTSSKDEALKEMKKEIL